MKKTSTKQLKIQRSLETLFPMIVLLVGTLVFFSFLGAPMSDIAHEPGVEMRG